MASYDDVMSALRNADAAGDSEAASRLADIASSLKRATATTQAAATPDQPDKELPSLGNMALGALETGTTGAAQAIGGTLAKGIGGIVGAVMPGQTAAGTADKFGKGFSDATDSFLSPETESGKAIMKTIGDATQGFQNYYQDPQNVQNTLGAIPFMPQSVAQSPQVGGVASGLAQALPDLSVLAPLVGNKTAGAKPSAPVKAKTGNAILDALDANIPSKPTEAPSAPIPETNPALGLDKSQAAYEQALREQQLTQQSAFNRPEGFDQLQQQSPMERMATNLGSEPGKLPEVPQDTSTPMGNTADQLTKNVGSEATMKAQDIIDARNKAHDVNAEALENNRRMLEDRAAQNNMDSSPSAEAQDHINQVNAEQAHQAHIEETHANALDEQKRLEDAQTAVEERQKAIDQSMSGVKSQWDGIRQLTAEKMPRNDLLDFEAEVRRQMDEAPTKSKAQVQREVAAKAESDRQRIIEQRATNEEMIQKMRDQHTESTIREKRAQADAQEAMAARDKANTAATTKAASDAAALRKQADAIAADKAKQDKALAGQAQQRALQEIAHPIGSKGRAAAVKAVKERFAKKDEGPSLGADKPQVKYEDGEYKAYKDGQQVGRLVSNITPEQGRRINEKASVDIVKVADAHKGTGVGSALYQAWHDDHGGAVEPSGKTSKEAWALWKNKYPEKVNNFVKQESDRIRSGAPRDQVLSNITDPEIAQRVVDAANGRINGGKQSGSFNYGDIGKGVTEGLDKLRNAFGSLSDPAATAKKYVKDSLPTALQSEAAVGKPIAPEDVIAKATAAGSTDIPLNPDATLKVPFTKKSFRYGGISESVQSGMNMAALKFKENPVLRGVQDFLNNGLARTNYQINTVVTPLIKMLNKLTPEEVVTHDGILQREQLGKKTFTDDQLRNAGMNDKQLAAYKMQRQAYESAFKLQNDALTRLGEKSLSRDDYYYSSRWSGDYHTPVTKDRLGPDGKPVIDPETKQPKQDMVWYIRTASRAENEKALAYLKDKYPELNIDDKTQPKYMGNNRNPNAPHDVAGAYRDMMGFFKDDPETTAAIKQAMESYTTAKGYSNLGQSKHFEHKAGVRGFQGDTPWNTPEESAAAGTKAQVDYLKNAIRWSNLQDTVANAKQVLSDPKVMEQHPNAVSLAQHTLNRELGLDTNIVAPIENMVAQFTGQSRNSVLRFVGDVKGMTYLQTLGLNPMYSLATPLQFMLTGPMMHAVMSMEGGYKTGVMGALKTMTLGMTDATAGIMAHMAHEMGTDSVESMVKKTGMSDLGAQALKYMEDSGYIKRNIFDESRQVGQHGFMDKTQAALGWTIGKPEQVARVMSMMSFVHHLDASGAFKGDNMALFHEAENYSDRALSSFKSYDRPMMVDKLGAVGQAGYVYQSFKFQNYHILNAAFRMLRDGNPVPIAALMGAYALGTGLMNMPGMQEMDGLVNFGKDMIAKHRPDLYTPAVRDFDLRDKLLNSLPDTKVFRQMSAKSIATNGLAGEATGLGLAPHASPGMIDTEHLSNNLPGAVMTQEAKEWSSVAGVALHPNKSSLTEALYKNMPGAKGPMEEYLPNIKQGNNPGNQVFINPNNMNAPKTMPYTRNLDDEAARKINAVSTRETNMKQDWYRSGQEDMRIKNALQGNIDGLLGAYHRGDTGDLADYAKAYMKLDPEGSRLDEAINSGVPAQYMSQEQQKITKANKLIAVQSLMRYRNMAK